MNPTIYREMQSGEILKEPIDITHEIWKRNWETWATGYESNGPTLIAMSPDDLEKTKKGEYTEGFREAVARMKEVIPSHMIGLQWELHKLYLNTL